MEVGHKCHESHGKKCGRMGMIMPVIVLSKSDFGGRLVATKSMYLRTYVGIGFTCEAGGSFTFRL